MAYKSQLVVRSRDRRGSDLIERVKELAGEQGKTYSEMALELLERALDGDTSEPVGVEEASEAEPVVEASSEPEESADDEASAEPDVEESEETEESEAETVEASTTPTPEPVPTSTSTVEDTAGAESAGGGAAPARTVPDVDGTPDEVAAQCEQALEDDGRQQAARILAGFFANASAMEGGEVKKELQKRVAEDDYQAILADVRQTPEYEDYKQRVIFGR